MRFIYLPLFTSLALLALSVGCASYEYHITRPPELARHIGTKADVVVDRDPLEYRFNTVDSRLVMRIYNPTDNPITLVGDKCTAVDPAGQSHPLQSQTMASHSFIKLILPPLRPHLERTGPSFGIGFGTLIGDNSRRQVWSGQDGVYDEPTYLAVYDNDTLYWDWNDESSIRLTLTFEQGNKSFEHEFVIARNKV